ncbi:hypothetical protein [Terasakiella sp.]|uniref:hypothetical protein n=1 Tax=Terasakiella sp. TaxID=2034861 RepID=UPI003AA83A82
MNNQRRKEINEIIAEVAALAEKIEELKERVEHIKGEEQEAFDNLPESLQQGERGQTMEEAIDALDNAYGELDTIDLEDTETYLSDATQ